jgi:hypothetical protein
MEPEERKANGLKGREWVTSDESGMSASNMSKKVIETVDKTFRTFVPRTRYDIIKVEEYRTESIKHKLIGY